MCAQFYGWSVNKHSSLLHPYLHWKWRFPKWLMTRNQASDDTRKHYICFCEPFCVLFLIVWHWKSVYPARLIRSPFYFLKLGPGAHPSIPQHFKFIRWPCCLLLAPLPSPLHPHLYLNRKKYIWEQFWLNLHPLSKVNFNSSIVEVTPWVTHSTCAAQLWLWEWVHGNPVLKLRCWRKRSPRNMWHISQFIVLWDL